MASLPGADRYRTPTASDDDAPWRHPLVVRANTEVRIEDVLNDHFRLHVPYDADGWKVRCPLAHEHEDGGVDRQFRVYGATNSGHCFALHGSLDPVRLWRLRGYYPSLLDAAQALLEAYGIDYRPKPYQERIAALLRPGTFQADPDAVVQAVNTFLAAHPKYEVRQYEQNVLHSVNLVLNEVHDLCARATSMEEVETWFQQARTRLSQTLEQPGN